MNTERLAMLVAASYVLTGCSAFGVRCELDNPGINVGNTKETNDAQKEDGSEKEPKVLLEGGEQDAPAQSE